MGTMQLTPHLQERVQQPDCDPARAVWQPASGGGPVSCLWRAVICHVVCASPHSRLMGTIQLAPYFQDLVQQQDCQSCLGKTSALALLRGMSGVTGASGITRKRAHIAGGK